MSTALDAKRAAKKKYGASAKGEIIVRKGYIGGYANCIIGMRVPLKTKIEGATAFVIFGRGRTWGEAIADLDKRLTLTLDEQSQ